MMPCIGCVKGLTTDFIKNLMFAVLNVKSVHVRAYMSIKIDNYKKKVT